VNYEDRIVAFIDILNFSGLIHETVDARGRERADKIKKIYDAFEVIQGNWKQSDQGAGIGRSKRVTIFSDSIVISVKSAEKSQIFWTLLEIKHLIMSLVWRGILVRGAIVRGKLIHEEEKVFGPALIEAYTLESKAALYPRIILDRELVQAAAESRSPHHSVTDEIGYVELLLESDADGMYYIDYFYKAQSELDDPDYDFPSYIEALGDIIRKGLMGSVHPSNADVRVKYSWMRERYNRMVERVTAPLRHVDLEAGEPDELQMFYSQLKKISPSRR
jgi:hypothetical protein